LNEPNEPSLFWWATSHSRAPSTASVT
jgi:hypothetical protein